MNHRKILIVEDEAALTSALDHALSKEGFVVSSSSDGKEGLDLALKTHPDVILLDILMPVMDGMVFLRKLRENSWGKDAKVFILTNLSDSYKEAECITLGVLGYLIKSNLSLSEIVEKIKGAF